MFSSEAVVVSSLPEPPAATRHEEEVVLLLFEGPRHSALLVVLSLFWSAVMLSAMLSMFTVSVRIMSFNVLEIFPTVI